jgi:hypothetical protein
MVSERTKHNAAQIAAEANEKRRATMDQSVRELELLAFFYNKHGYTKEASEIRQAIANLRKRSGNP